MGGKSRQHKSEKRRKELTRQARQKEKRERRTDKTPGGGGPPIDWSEAPPGVVQPDQPVSGPVPDASEDQNT